MNCGASVDKKQGFETGQELPQLPGAEWATLGSASRDKADAFLHEHTQLARLRSEELRDDLKLHHWRMRVEHWSGLLKLSFEIALAVLVLLVVIAIGTAIWSAAHDRALVIEPFSVPPDIAARGLDGRTIAAHLQDKLAAMQNLTQSVRPADSYSNDWGNDIKVQIPETGVSIGEVHRLLVAWLGHQTHITGDVWRSPSGVAITTRTGGETAATITGTDADFDKLLQRAAETIYRHTQPYRYAVYLQIGSAPDWPRIRAILNSLLLDRSPRERAWAYIGLSNIDSNDGNNTRSLDELHRAAAVLPGFALPWQNMTGGESSIGHEEDAVAHAAVAIRLLPNDREVAPELRAAQLPLMRGIMEVLSNDYTSALRDYSAAAALPVPSNIAETVQEQILLAKAFLHDGAGVRTGFNALPPTSDASVLTNRGAIQLVVNYVLGNWAVLAANYDKVETELVNSAKAAGFNDGGVQGALNRQVRPYFAVALAMHGELDRARVLIDQTPLDCDICLRARGRIAARERRWAAAQYWFARAVQHAPSIALGYSDWGRTLLDKGDLDGAIAKFAAANRKQPHFADPIEMWGEALTAKNRSDLALVKFEEAAKYAPAWGRLHLKWGEALFYAGHAAEARDQFARAAKLDLASSERTELKRFAHG